MAKYIDRDNLIKALGVAEHCDDCQFSQGPFCHREKQFTDACEVIFDLPTADVIEVVRCKDCKFYETNQDECVFYHAQWVKHEDDFCPYGERREK